MKASTIALGLLFFMVSPTSDVRADTVRLVTRDIFSAEYNNSDEQINTYLSSLSGKGFSLSGSSRN